MRKIAFIIPPSVKILDLAGPLQVFTEVKFYDFELELEFYSYTEETVCNSGLVFGKIAHYSEANLKEGDYILWRVVKQQNVITNWTNKWETRRITFSATYDFRSGKKKSVKATDLQDEKNRL
ncbi:helix-turn-helix domain-containing protein [Flavobacterium soyangense]|uniref:Uncharacterized protein n=1 Tax=Flavobacterium soyangense TaxID=2023265 RepID=A0A930Y162_9FLAO|nr:hypothetical protein [Flavobacterium soyangense]MBF2709129.1 hypothetical protein [Flavobacterium soyangense]